MTGVATDNHRSALSIEGQLALLRRGALEILSEEELADKLRRSAATGKPLRVKLGMDPTAPDIHLGFAVVLRKLRQFQDLGHEVVLLIGDFTAMIGDPSGRNETRKPLTAEEVRENARTYREQYSKILDPARTIVLFNSEWLARMTFADVIRLTSRGTVARLLERDDFAKRFAEQRPIACHELLYPFCQAYDSVHLRADVEMGGSDQRFNILMGRDLQRESGQEAQVAFFMPLLVGLDGVQKMSKSLGNYIGVSEPPKEIFGKVMRITDDMMRTYYELTTDVPMEAVDRLLSGHPMEAKKHLAQTLVSMYHGEAAGEEARREFERVFSQREIPEEMPEVTVPADELTGSGRIWIARLLTLAGMAGGTREARRLVEGGGVTLDHEKITDPTAEVAVKTGAVLRVGRRRFARLVRDRGEGDASRPTDGDGG
jgi:tyrosyl-tRNA synthetase